MDDLNIKATACSNISNVFNKLRKEKRKALIPFITAGYPDPGNYLKLFYTLEQSGADIIEIGIPYSDPIADGPVIQKSSAAAIQKGINTDIVLDLLFKIRQKTDIPVVILAYFNTIYKYGTEKFLRNAGNAGADGLIVPDLPLEEFYKYRQFYENNKIDNIMLASLTTATERLKLISSISRGFIYCVAVKGVTGIRDNVSSDTKEFLIKLKNITDVPLALGFGISNARGVLAIKDYCDAVIIGSKVLSLFMESGNENNGFRDVSVFISEINSILKS